MFYKQFSELCAKHGISNSKVLLDLGLSKSNNTAWKSGRNEPSNEIVKKLADYFNVSVDYLLNGENKKSSVNITEDYTTFPVIGEVAAGYDIPALEDWSGDTIDIPNNYLRGRSTDEFFVLKVKGDSMYPTYQNGDKVLILKQSTLNYSGQVGVVLYDDDLGTLKKVEYKKGEDWMNLVPINPAYPPIRITGEALEHCRILGIPKLLIREIEE